MTLDIQTVAYAANYCEENVWQLSRHPQLPSGIRYVVFVSNTERTCALWCQRAAPEAGSPVVWDYHVLLLVEGRETWVFDLDSTLGVPVTLERYLAETFPFDGRLEKRLRPTFRLVESGEFRRTFASDRSHMLDSEGQWRHRPPPWPMIQAPGASMNLSDFIDMKAPAFGEVIDMQGLRLRFNVADPLAAESG
ncbi:MAG: protein N-terminal glutamine amidohydrolase [Acidobacteriota bacterium]